MEDVVRFFMGKVLLCPQTEKVDKTLEGDGIIYLINYEDIQPWEQSR